MEVEPEDLAGALRCGYAFCDRDADEIVAAVKKAQQLELQIEALKKEEQDTRNQYTALKHSAASRISELEEDLGRANGNVSLLLSKLRNQLDGIVKDWGEAFAKHGFILHPGLTPEQNAAEWAAKVQEKDRLISELREIVDLAVDLGGVSFHEESCPQDDTCFCGDVKRVNGAMGLDFQSKRRAGSINLPTTEKRKCECIPGVHKNCPEHGYPAMRPIEGPGSADE